MDVLKIKNATIMFRNFRGEGRKFNPEGRRNFCVVLPEEDAIRLKEDGWNIRLRDPSEDGDEMTGTLRVEVSWKNPRYLPKVVLVTSKGKTQLDEDDVHILDSAAIDKVDVAIRPREWEVNGASGVKAYLKTMYVTVEDDEFEDDYEDIGDL